jgi:hypothetical protein
MEHTKRHSQGNTSKILTRYTTYDVSIRLKVCHTSVSYLLYLDA